MKKILFFTLVALLGIYTADAQRRGSTRTPEQIVENLDKKLNLTDEQEKLITELYTEFFKKELSRDERRSEMEKLNGKIASILTDEQKKVFEQMKKERLQRRRS